MDLLAEKLFEIGARFYSDAFQCFAFVADDDAFLGVALDHNQRTDADNVVVFEEFFGLDLDGVWEFLVVVQ